jgi:hypothetical protein
MWQLTESAKDLFTIRIFHRIEVDEMLPESTLREIRRSRAAHWTRSPELGVTHVDENKETTPIEPLSLDSSLDNVAGEDVVTPRASVVNQEAAIDQEEDCKTPTAVPNLQVDVPEDGIHGQVQGQQAEEAPLPLQLPDSPTTKSFDGDADGDDDEETLPIMMIVDDESPATQPQTADAKLAGSPMPPPMKSHMHRRLPSRQLPPLPTIPEIVATAPPEDAALSPTSVVQPPASKVNTDDYVFLQSNRYTLTMPAFRHGEIRLAKADLPIGKLAAAVDDTLDWTAFQMAILGGAGDFFSEPTDYSRPSDAELDELEGLASWFGSFGFQSAGTLVGPSEEAPRTPTQAWTPVMPLTPALSPPSPTSTPNSSPRPVVGARSPGIIRIDPPSPSDADKANNTCMASFGNTSSDSIAGRFFPTPSLGPVGPGYSRTHRRSASSTTFGQRPPKQKVLHTSSSFENRRNHAGLAIDSGRRPSIDSIQSLPQSPMMDLVVSHDVEGNEYVVPMGFNLSHDLGDFLTWHAEHVSGTEGSQI